MQHKEILIAYSMHVPIQLQTLICISYLTTYNKKKLVPTDIFV